jgi:hypothetical protein
VNLSFSYWTLNIFILQVSKLSCGTRCTNCLHKQHLQRSMHQLLAQTALATLDASTACTNSTCNARCINCLHKQHLQRSRVKNDALRTAMLNLFDLTYFFFFFSSSSFVCANLCPMRAPHQVRSRRHIICEFDTSACRTVSEGQESPRRVSPCRRSRTDVEGLCGSCHLPRVSDLP